MQRVAPLELALKQHPLTHKKNAVVVVACVIKLNAVQTLTVEFKVKKRTCHGYPQDDYTVRLRKMEWFAALLITAVQSFQFRMLKNLQNSQARLKVTLSRSCI